MLRNIREFTFVMLLAIATPGSWLLAEEATMDATFFDEQVRAFFEADSGKPLERAKKQPPLRPGRGNYTRAYSFSIVNFAARCFYLNQQLDEANAALVENAQHYLDNPKDIVDRDSFHWHADIVMRLIDMYGPNGSVHPGRLTAETAAICLEPIWIYVEHSSKYNKANHKESRTWHFHSTENHHAMDFTTQWHFAKLAKDHPNFRDHKLRDGRTMGELYRDWNDYFVVYCNERARKGTNIEIMCPGYNMVWMKGIYNFHDFGEPDVRKAAGMLMDLYWAYWAQEQRNGVEAGGKTRIRGVNGFSHRVHGVPAVGWMYFGIGQKPNAFMGGINALLSGYRPPAVVADIAKNAISDEPYEIRQRAQGLGKQGIGQAVVTDTARPNEFRDDGGGIVRYSYCDPAFIIGTLMHEPRPLDDWPAISTQSRWQGIIFSDSPGARIVPVVRPAGRARDVLNGHWSVQRKGSLITHKLKDNSKGGPMIVWISKDGISEPVREDDWVFVETDGAYAAIRVVGSDFKISDKPVSNPNMTGPPRSAPPGRFVVADDDFAPVILEVMSKRDVEDFDEFKRRVKAAALSIKGSVLSYETIYGDTLTLDTRYKQGATINGKPVDYAPPKVHQSPYLNSVYDSGVVTISRGDQTLTLDFNLLESN